MSSPFGWLVADGWCWFVLREEYCWLVAGGWFVVREKYCWLVADKPSEQGRETGGQLAVPWASSTTGGPTADRRSAGVGKLPGGRAVRGTSSTGQLPGATAGRGSDMLYFKHLTKH
jgi:hypothetical protein